MKILNVRPLERRTTPRGNTPIARFNLQLTPEIVLFDWLLQRTADGRVGAYPALAGHGVPVATISPRVRALVATAVLNELNESENDRSAA